MLLYRGIVFVSSCVTRILRDNPSKPKTMSAIAWVLALALGLAGALYVYWQQAEAKRKEEEELKRKKEALAREQLAAKKSKPKAKKVDITAELKKKKQQQEEDALDAGKEHQSLLHVLKGHKFALTAAAYSPNGRFLATASTDRTIRIYVRATLNDKNARVHQINIEYDHVTAMSFSSDGRTLVRCQGRCHARVETCVDDDSCRSSRQRAALSSSIVRTSTRFLWY